MFISDRLWEKMFSIDWLLRLVVISDWSLGRVAIRETILSVIEKILGGGEQK